MSHSATRFHTEKHREWRELSSSSGKLIPWKENISVLLRYKEGAWKSNTKQLRGKINRAIFLGIFLTEIFIFSSSSRAGEICERFLFFSFFHLWLMENAARDTLDYFVFFLPLFSIADFLLHRREIWRRKNIFLVVQGWQTSMKKARFQSPFQGCTEKTMSVFLQHDIYSFVFFLILRKWQLFLFIFVDSSS